MAPHSVWLWNVAPWGRSANARPMEQCAGFGDDCVVRLEEVRPAGVEGLRGDRVAARARQRAQGCRTDRYLCRAEGLRHDGANSALADADATARLLAVYLKRATAAGIVTAVDLGVAPLLIPTPEPAPAASAAVRIRTTPPLDRRSLPADATGDPRLDAYLDLLEGVLADHVVTADEERQLAELVIASGLDPRRVAACRHAVSLSPHAETAP